MINARLRKYLDTSYKGIITLIKRELCKLGFGEQQKAYNDAVVAHNFLRATQRLNVNKNYMFMSDKLADFAIRNKNV